MGWKLKVSGYGKIGYAEIEMAPLTLFVGDNNSGKSYLMSLLWGIQNLGMEEILKGEGDEKEELAGWMRKQMSAVKEHGDCTVSMSEISDMLHSTLDEGLKRNKNNLAKKIFNSADVKIEELQIILNDIDKVLITFGITKEDAEEEEWFYIKSSIREKMKISFSEEMFFTSNHVIVVALVGLVTGINFFGANFSGYDIYLPAARTGFMLTKDIVNKVGRNKAFNIDMEQKEVTPFVRPINQFLDVINDLILDGEGDEKYKKVTAYLENSMAEGIIEMSALPNREVLYVPEGLKSGIPLRIVSAVVTELSPLILILKHKKNLGTLFYEEPEMCLHPQLQQKMARVICQLVNADLKMLITTHSDIILQHINNMIRLSVREDAQELCSQFGYNTTDMLNAENVRVYQLKSENGEKTKVEEIVCGKNGFAIPTFNEALDKIMDEAYSIQE